DMTRRLTVSAALTVPLVVLAMLDMAGAMPPSSARAIALAELGLATPVVLWGGFSFFERAWRSIVGRSPDMFTLIGLGVGAAYLYSASVVLLPDAFADSIRDGVGALPSYFETAAAIVTL